MKILITGANGQLGSELLRVFKENQTELGDIPLELKGAEIIPTDMEELDITDSKAVADFVAAISPDIIINSAAYTNVDACESNPDLAYKINAAGARNLAVSAEKCGAKLVHISTDYVFDGKASTPYRESSALAPNTVYGASKKLGETLVSSLASKYFIVRTSWLYGYYGSNFVKTIIKAASERGELKVVNDQYGNPTNAADLAHHILKIAVTENYGIYHCTGNGECTWYDFACGIIRLANISCKIEPCTTAEFPRPASRPAYSALDNMMLRITVGDEMRPWSQALEYFMSKHKENLT